MAAGVQDRLTAERDRQGLAPKAIPAPVAAQVQPPQPQAQAGTLGRLNAEKQRQGLIDAPAVEPQPQQEQPSLISQAIELATGRQRTAALPAELRDRPEVLLALLTGELKNFSLAQQGKLGLGLLVSIDPQARIDVVLNALELPDSALQKIGDTTFVEINGKQFPVDAPGISAIDSAQFLTEIAAFIPAARVTKFAASVLGRALVSAGTSAATSVALDVAAGQLGSEQGIDPLRAVLAGAGGAAAEVAVPLFRAGAGALARRAGVAIGPERAASRLERVAGIERTTDPVRQTRIDENIADLDTAGIQAAPGQVLESPRGQFAMERVAQTDPGAIPAQEFLERQTEQAFESVDRLKESISIGDASLTGAEGVQSALNARRQVIKAARREKTSTLYDQAHAEGIVVDVGDIVEELDRVLEEVHTGGPINLVLKSLRDDIKKAGDSRSARDNGSNLRALHNARVGINERLAKFGEGGLGPQSSREVILVKEQLTERMEGSGGSELYREARQRFIDASPELNEFDASIIGKIRRVKSDNLQQVVSETFKSEQSVRRVMREVNKADPSGETWGAITRANMEKRLGGIGEDASTATPFKIRNAIFGRNRDQRRAFFAALTPMQTANAVALERSLKLIEKGRKVGSPTEAAQRFTRDLGGFAPAVVRWLDPRGSLQEKIIESTIENRSKDLAEIIYNPRYVSDLSVIRKIKGDQSKQRKAMLDLLNRVARNRERIGSERLETGARATLQATLQAVSPAPEGNTP